ncbi:MAG: DUF2062 domain-containing protein [Candidatus Puniceispirillaceae bacterium]
MFKRRQSSIWHKISGFLWPKKGFQRSFIYIKERLMRMPGSTHSLAIGVACGAAASMTPFLGFHFGLAAFMAVILRGNLVCSAIGTIIGNPWTFPFIWSLDIWIGKGVIEQFNLNAVLMLSSQPDLGIDMGVFYPLSIGGVLLSVLTFPFYYVLSYYVVQSWRSHRMKRLEKKRAEKLAADRVEKARQIDAVQPPSMLHNEQQNNERAQ